MRNLVKAILFVLLTLSLITVFLCCSKNAGQSTEDSKINEYAQNGIIVKAEKYAYNDSDVIVMHVDNRSSNAYMLTIEGYFYDANGNELKTRTTKFDGFPGGFSNYFLLQPGIKFDSFEYKITTESYRYKTLADYLKLPTELRSYSSDSCLQENSSIHTDKVLDMNKTYVALWTHLYPFVNTYPGPLCISGHILIFDNKGELYLIHEVSSYALSNDHNNTGPVIQSYVSDVPIENINRFEYPENLVNANGMFALSWVGRLR